VHEMSAGQRSVEMSPHPRLRHRADGRAGEPAVHRHVRGVGARRPPGAECARAAGSSCSAHDSRFTSVTIARLISDQATRRIIRGSGSVSASSKNTSERSRWYAL